MDLSAAGLGPGMQLNTAALSADQAAGLLGLIPADPSNPTLATARQALALSTAQASAHEAAYYCTVSCLHSVSHSLSLIHLCGSMLIVDLPHLLPSTMLVADAVLAIKLM